MTNIKIATLDNLQKYDQLIKNTLKKMMINL